jgi:hypothetical protein
MPVQDSGDVTGKVCVIIRACGRAQVTTSA